MNWLHLFCQKSILELDYGGLATFLDSELRASKGGDSKSDPSIKDAQHSIARLDAGESAIAGEGYERLVARWR